MKGDVSISTVQRVAVALIVLMLHGIAYGGDLKLYPNLTIGEEYTDNVYESRDNRTSDFITRIMPGVTFAYKAPVLETELNYHYDYRYYAKGSYGTDTTHYLVADAKLTAIDNFLFITANEHYDRVSLDFTKDRSKESLFVDQTDTNVITVSPYITLYPESRTSVKTGYRLVDTRYFDTPDAVDKQIHAGFFTIRHDLTPHWSTTWSYTYSRELNDVNGFSNHLAFVGLRYEYDEKTFVFAEGGYTWFDYDDGQQLNTPYWKAGGSYTLEPITVSLSSGVKYDEDPLNNASKETYFLGKVERRFSRGMLSLSPYYSEYLQAKTNTSSGLATRKYGATALGQYDLFPRLNTTLTFTAERYDDQDINSHTWRYITDFNISYLLTDHLTGTFNYIYVKSSSPVVSTDNYDVNRVMLALTMHY